MLLKKFISGAIALFLGLLAVGFLGAPANASQPLPKEITYCQAQGNGGYHQITANVRSLVDNKGHLKQGGVNQNDIVGPFAWDFGGDDHGTFAGSAGWSGSESQNFIDRGCVPADTRKVVVPPTPVYTPGTCANPTGTFANETAEGSVQSYKRITGDLAPTWVINYTPADGYKFAEGAKTTFTFPVVGPNASDPLFDTATGSCRMPDTGAHGVSANAIMWGGGMIFAGLLVFSITNVIGRRKTA